MSEHPWPSKRHPQNMAVCLPLRREKRGPAVSKGQKQQTLSQLRRAVWPVGQAAGAGFWRQ